MDWINYVDVNEGDGFCDNLPEIVRRTWTVTDACGNVSTCEQTIRVGIEALSVLCDTEDFIQECYIYSILIINQFFYRLS